MRSLGLVIGCALLAGLPFMAHAECEPVEPSSEHIRFLRAAEAAVELRTGRDVSVLDGSTELEFCNGRFELIFEEEVGARRLAWFVRFNRDLTHIYVSPPK